MASVDDEAILLDFAMLGGTELFLGVMPRKASCAIAVLLRTHVVIPSHRFSR